jgi:hypothetical protein
MITLRAMASYVLLSMLVGPGLGCSRAVSGPEFRAPRSNAQPARELITEAEILGHPNLATGYDLVRWLRPGYLASARRRTTDGAFLPPVVYIDDQRAGDVSALRQIHAQVIAEVRYVPPREALTEDGELSGGGKIMVYTRRSRTDPWPRR